MNLSNSQRLARFVCGLRFSDLPSDVVEKAKELALHSLGVQLAASTLPWSRQVFRYVRSQGGVPQSTVVNYGLRTTAANAAFANGSFAHGFEMDDNHGRSSVKAGCVTVPTALAIGEERVSSGPEVIVALAAGHEIMVRVGVMIRDSEHRHGSHPTGTTGALGAAVVAGRLLGLDELRLTYALGSGGVQRSGLSEVPSGGRGHLKRTFGGMAAANGIRAALLAREGLTSPITTLDYGSGFTKSFEVGREAVEGLTLGLGESWEMLRTHYKIYAQDGYIQPMSQAFETMRRRHHFRVEDIESVWVGTNRLAYEQLIGTIRDPKDITDAQFSANFSAALFLVTGGGGFESYTEENLHDPVIRELADRVEVAIDPEIDSEHLRSSPRGAKVAVRLKDGAEYREKVDNLRELSPAQVDDKYRNLSRLVLDDEHSESILTSIHQLESVRDISSIARNLVTKSTYGRQ